MVHIIHMTRVVKRFDKLVCSVVIVASVCKGEQVVNNFFTITAEIHVRSLANFYCQYADRHMNLKFV